MIHEAAHGVAAVASRVPVLYISTEDHWRPEALGVIVTAQPFGALDWESILLFLLAAGVAEQRRYPHLSPAQLHDAGDLEIVRMMVASDAALVDLKRSGHFRQVPRTSDRVTAAVDVWRARAARLVDEHWLWILNVAEVLEQRRRLSQGEIETLRPNHG